MTDKNKILLLIISNILFFLSFNINFFKASEEHWFLTRLQNSDSRILGRLVKSQRDGIFSNGGLNGRIWKKCQNERINENAKKIRLIQYKDITCHKKEMIDYQLTTYLNNLDFTYHEPYKSQVGAQGMLFSLLDKVIPFAPVTKLKIFNTLTSLLTSFVISLIILWFYRRHGLLCASLVIISVITSQWLIVFGRNIWWCTWAFYLPMLVVLHFFETWRKRSNNQIRLFSVIIFLSIFLKCMFNGYEFMTTTLIMMMVPIYYYAILEKWNVKKLFKFNFSAAIFSIIAILLTMVILCIQVSIVDGSFQDGIDHLIYSFFKRSHANPIDYPAKYFNSFQSSTLNVIKIYLQGTFIDLGNFLQAFSIPAGKFKFKVLYWQLVCLVSVFTTYVLIRNKKFESFENRGINPTLAITTWISILAPFSWYIIFKAHSYLHTHLNFILWQMPFTLFGFAIFGITIKYLQKDVSLIKKYVQDKFLL